MEKKRSKLQQPASHERVYRPSPEKRCGANDTLSDLHANIDKLQARLIEVELQNSDLLQAQEDVQRAARVYTELYEHSPVAHFVLDRNGVILRANQTAGDLLGLDAPRLIRKPFLIFVLRETLNDYRAHCREAILTRQRVTCHALLRPRTAEPLWVRLDTVGMHDPERDELVCHMAVVPFQPSEQPVATQPASEEIQSCPEAGGQPNVDLDPDAAHPRELAHDINGAVAGVKNILQLLKPIVSAHHPYARYIPLGEAQLNRIVEAVGRHTRGD